MVRSLDDFSSLPSAPGVLYCAFFLFQENTYNVNTTPQISLFTWCKYNTGRIPQHQTCWLFELTRTGRRYPNRCGKHSVLYEYCIINRCHLSDIQAN